MNLKEIKIGTRFEIELLDTYAEKSNTTYVSQLLEHAANKSMVAATPIHEARLLYIPMDSLVRIYFLHPREGYLSFTARLKAKSMRGKISVMSLVPESDVEKLQRRKHFRLECLLGIEYILLDSTGKPSSDKWAKGVLKNISAAGACLVLDNDLVKGTGLKFKLFLTENLLISAQASVIRSSRVENKNVKKFEHGLYFTEISENDQNKLIKYIFEQQRLILNREAQ